MKTEMNTLTKQEEQFQNGCSAALMMLEAKTPLRMAQGTKEEFGPHYGGLWKPHTTGPNSRKRAYILVCLSILLSASLLLAMRFVGLLIITRYAKL